MKKDLKIGQGLKVTVYWYDHVPEPPRSIEHEGEVVGWRRSQLIVRVRDYAVVRFWKRTGLEVGNSDHARRGFRVDLSEITPGWPRDQNVVPPAAAAPATASGISIKLDA
jgi:hypothetical protein